MLLAWPSSWINIQIHVVGDFWDATWYHCNDMNGDWYNHLCGELWWHRLWLYKDLTFGLLYAWTTISQCTLKTATCHDANSFVTGGTGSCRNNNLHCRLWRQSWHDDNSWSSASAWQWRHNGCDGVSNQQPHHCLLNRLFGRRSKETSKLRITGLCAGNSPVPHKWAVTWKMFDDVIMEIKAPTSRLPRRCNSYKTRTLKQV